MRWISCKDQMPERSGRYAVCYQYRGRGPLRVFIADYDVILGWSVGMTDAEIMHWLELPELPEAKPEGEKK